MKLKKITTRFSAALLSVFLLCTAAFATRLTINSSASYTYAIELTATVTIDKTAFTEDDFLSLSLFSGSKTVISDSSGAAQSVSLSSVYLNSVLMNTSSVSFVYDGGSNCLPPSEISTFVWKATAVLPVTATDPGTILDISTASVPLVITYTHDGEGVYLDCSKKIKATAKAALISDSVSNIITKSSFNKGSGLTDLQKTFIKNSTGDFSVVCYIKNPGDADAAFAFRSDLTSESVLASTESGAKSVTFSVPKSFLYNADTDTLFTALTVDCSSESLDFSKITFDFSLGDIYSEEKDFVLNYSSLTLNVGESLLLTSTQSVAWNSSSTAVASISADGTLTARKAGTATITATDLAGRKIACNVTVIDSSRPITSLTLKNTNCIVRVGKKYTLSYTVSPENTTDVITWSSSDSEILSVNPSTGQITAMAPGEASVTAVSSNGTSRTAAFIVKLP